MLCCDAPDGQQCVVSVCACRPGEEEEFYDSFDVEEDPDCEHVDKPTEHQTAPTNETPVVRSVDSHVTGSAVPIQEALNRIQANLQMVLQRLNGLEDAVKSQQRQRGEVRGWKLERGCIMGLLRWYPRDL